MHTLPLTLDTAQDLAPLLTTLIDSAFAAVTQIAVKGLSVPVDDVDLLWEDDCFVTFSRDCVEFVIDQLRKTSREARREVRGVVEEIAATAEVREFVLGQDEADITAMSTSFTNMRSDVAECKTALNETISDLRNLAAQRGIKIGG